MFSILTITNFAIWVTFNLSSANAFNMDWSKILLFSKVLKALGGLQYKQSGWESSYLQAKIQDKSQKKKGDKKTYDFNPLPCKITGRGVLFLLSPSLCLPFFLASKLKQKQSIPFDSLLECQSEMFW